MSNSKYRTDRNNNPIAFTTDIAYQGGLNENVDYLVGDSFDVNGHLYHTAKLLKNPIETCIRVIDNIGFYTRDGQMRWIYIGIPKFIWDSLAHTQKVQVIYFMYLFEGGNEMKPLFEKSLGTLQGLINFSKR